MKHGKKKTLKNTRAKGREGDSGTPGETSKKEEGPSGPSRGEVEGAFGFGKRKALTQKKRKPKKETRREGKSFGKNPAPQKNKRKSSRKDGE